MASILYIFCLVLLMPVFASAQTQTPPGVDITLDSLLISAKNIGGFLMVAGGVLVAITLIGTGIMYLISGGNAQKIAGAKSMFKAGLIGALIIFSPGLLIGTISGFSSNPFGFFGGGGGTTTSTGGTPTPTSVASVTYGCNSSGSCVQVTGGIFADSTCAGQCGGAGGQSVGGACFNCANTGGVWCLATASCIANELSCPGVFTKVAGGCP